MAARRVDYAVDFDLAAADRTVAAIFAMGGTGFSLWASG
jgi:hypothetical protein